MEFTTGIHYSAVQQMSREGTEVMELNDIQRIEVLQWSSCDKRTPVHSQEVIIAVEKNHYVAIFDADHHCFSLKYNSRKKFYPTKQHIEWIAV